MADEVSNQVTRKLITEASNDYQSSAALSKDKVSYDITDATDDGVYTWFITKNGQNYSGTIVPTYDPLDTTGKNKVLRHREYASSMGIIRLGDDYTSPVTTSGINAEVGKTYKFNFKWMTEGYSTRTAVEFGIGLAKADYTEKVTYVNDIDSNNVKVLKTIANHSNGTNKWEEMTAYFEVTSDMAETIKTYPQLVIWVKGGGKWIQGNADLNGYGMCTYFDDITVTSLAKYTETIYAENDFSTANYGNVVQGSAWKYRGASFVGVDPDDAGNKVVENKTGYKDLGVIYLNDAYTSNLPKNFIKATAGTTYTISFKWKYNGTQKSGVTRIGVGLAQTSVDGDDGSKYSYPDFAILDIDSKQVITSVAAGTYSDIEWKTETVRYTVPANADLTTYPNLVLYTQNTNTATDISYYFDDITVSTKIAAATVNFVYEGNAANNFTTVKKSVYFEDGNILDYQPEDLPVAVKWYVDEMYTEEYDFTKDYTEYMDITLYGVSQYAKGDIDADGSINARDMVLMRQYLLDIITGTIRFYDINSDNKIDIRDLVSLKNKMVYPKVNELSSITLSLYKKEEDTYTYGIAWQSDVQLSQPVVEIMQADESDWANAKRIVGNSANSVSHQTFQIKEGWNYNTISDDYKAAGGTGAWYHSGITMSHDINVIYSNKLLINGLSAGQSYKYRVGDAFNKKYSGEGIFTAYNDANSDFNFIYMADSQQSFASSNVNAWSNTLNAAFTSMNDAEFIAMGGDLINWNAIEAQWKGLLDYNKNYVMNIPIMPAAGNHEINMTASGTGIEYGDFNSHFNLPYNNDYDDEINSVGDFKSTAKPQHFVNGATGAYYSYDYKNVHFVVLNTNDIYISHRDRTDGKYVLGDAQMAWLNADLANAKQREENGEIDFTIVYMHAGLYTTGAAGLGGDYKETYDLYDQLQSVFADNGVDIVLSGHDHVYSCTKMLDRNGDVVETGGVVYMTGGVAGVNGPSASRFYSGEVAKDVNEVLLYNTTNDVTKYDCGLIDEKYNNCWTEFNVTADKITVTTYSNDLNGGYIDKFEISNNQKTVIS